MARGLLSGAGTVMSIALSHRGNLQGPNPSVENRIPALRAALDAGCGIETDLRRADDGRFYLSYDEQASPEGMLAEDGFAIFRAYPHATIALNIREPGGESALLDFLESQDVLPQMFLMGMELIEATPGSTARRFRALHKTVRLAARASERGESIDRALALDVASVIWIDEFERPWCTRQDVQRLKQAGRAVYAVSPDLHGASLKATYTRWRDFLRWGVDGICTDQAAALGRLLRALDQDTAA